MKVMVKWINMKSGLIELLPIGKNPNILYGESGWVMAGKVAL